MVVEVKVDYVWAVYHGVTTDVAALAATATAMAISRYHIADKQ